MTGFDSLFMVLKVLLSRVNLFASKDGNSGLHMYRQTAEAVMCGLIPKSPTATSSRTDGNSFDVFSSYSHLYPFLHNHQKGKKEGEKNSFLHLQICVVTN